MPKILSIKDMLETTLQTSLVPVPEWADESDNPDECFVKIRELSANDRIEMAERMTDENLKMDPGKVGEFAPFLLSRCLIDGEGECVCTEEQAAALQRKSAIVVNRIARAISALSGLNREAQEQAVKN